MHIQLAHKTSQAAAITRIKKGLIDARPHMAGQVSIKKEEWDGNTLNFAFLAQNKEVTGQLQVTDTEFVLDAKLPLMWRLFEGKIEKMIHDQAGSLLK